LAAITGALALVPSAAGLTEQQKLTVNDGAEQDQRSGSGGEAFDNFGWSVALDGDTAVAGAPYDDVGANADQGSAFVFVRAGTAWLEQAQLLATGGTADDSFGTSVALRGENAVVGAPYYGDAPTARQGAAYVFARSGTVWGEPTPLTATDAAAGDNFGTSVALDGTKALVGSPYGGARNGAAYLYQRSGTSWFPSLQLLASDGAAVDGLGWSVAADGGTALAGAPGDDVTYQDDGSAYVFEPPPTAVAAAGLSARRAGSSVVLRWRGSDPTVLGYRVYRARTLLTPRLLTAGANGLYRHVDRSAPRKALRYRLQAVRTDGSTTWAGSAEVLQRATAGANEALRR
jgi:hypothetical protein